MPSELLKGLVTTSEVTSAVLFALERSGYVERSFFRTNDDGIVLVTRLERIEKDGAPVSNGGRWPTFIREPASLDIVGFLRGLFFIDPGHYRLIVFVFQQPPFSQSSDKISQKDARELLRLGVNMLPAEIAGRPFSGACTVLVYEFASDGGAVQVIESELTGKQHLEKAGILAQLNRPN
jgi:hypothetical protein